MKHKIFYGWIVCGMCCLMVFVTMGTVSNGLSVFLPYIIREYGITNTQGSSLVTLRCLFAFVAMIFIGHYYDAVGYRLGTAVATGLCGIAFAVYAVADGYGTFCIGAAISGISYGLGSMIPVSVIMSRWFMKHRALAIGICGAGSGVATICLPPIITGIIETESMDIAFIFVSVYVFLFAAIIFIFLRGTPADKGLDTYGSQEIYEEALRSKASGSDTCSSSFGSSRGKCSSPSGSSEAKCSSSTGTTTSRCPTSTGSMTSSRSLSRKGWILMGFVSLLMVAAMFCIIAAYRDNSSQRP